MEKRLKRKFIKTAMTAVLVSLSFIYAALCAASFVGFHGRAERLLDMITESPPDLHERRFALPKIKGQGKAKIFTEDPFSVRMFTVKADSEKHIISTDTSRIAAKPDETLKYGEKVLKSGKNTGFLKNYAYRVAETSYGYTAVFVDMEREMDIFFSALLNNALIVAASSALIFIAVSVLSKRAVSPIVESYEKQKRFITDASHELKTPLAVIKTNTDVIEMKYGSGKWTDNIKHQTDKLNALISRMISLTKLEENAFTPAKTVFNISQLIKDVIGDFSPIAHISGKRFDYRIEEGLSCKGDAELIRRLFEILTDNAVKYSDTGTVIDVSLKQNQKIEFSIKNNCSGIRTGNYAKLFDRFVRLDDHRNSKTGGHGIGLSLAKLICEKQGGTIYAYSDDDGIFSITVRL